MNYNELIAHAIRIACPVLTPRTAKVYMWIVGRTWTWTKDEEMITIRQMIEGLGQWAAPIDLSRATITRAVAELQEMGALKVKRTPDNRTTYKPVKKWPSKEAMKRIKRSKKIEEPHLTSEVTLTSPVRRPKLTSEVTSPHQCGNIRRKKKSRDNPVGTLEAGRSAPASMGRGRTPRRKRKKQSPSSPAHSVSSAIEAVQAHTEKRKAARKGTTLSGTDLMEIWNDREVNRYPISVTKKRMGQLVQYQKRWAKAYPDGDFADYLEWVLSAWAFMVSSYWHWMKPVPVAPSIDIMLVRSDEVEQHFWKNRQRIQKLMDMATKDKVYYDLRDKGMSHDKAVKEAEKYDEVKRAEKMLLREYRKCRKTLFRFHKAKASATVQQVEELRKRDEAKKKRRLLEMDDDSL